MSSQYQSEFSFRNYDDELISLKLFQNLFLQFTDQRVLPSNCSATLSSTLWIILITIKTSTIIQLCDICLRSVYFKIIFTMENCSYSLVSNLG